MVEDKRTAVGSVNSVKESVECGSSVTDTYGSSVTDTYGSSVTDTLLTHALSLCMPSSNEIVPVRTGSLLAASPSVQDSLMRAAVVSIGAFDGIHRGHQALLEAAKEDAVQKHAPFLVVMFDPDPSVVLTQGAVQPMLLMPHDRAKGACIHKADAVLLVPFTAELAACAYQDFFLQVIAPVCSPVAVHVGKNFRLGAAGSGDISAISALGSSRGFTCYAHDLLCVDGEIVSATRARSALAEGNLEEVHRLLGRYHYVRGVVKRGQGLGGQLGFPTANVFCDSGLALPSEGVYAGYILHHGAVWPAAINVGASKTFSAVESSFLEATLLGFEGDLYDETLVVVFVRRLRDMVAFSSVDELVASVQRDITWVRTNLGNESFGVVT